MPPTDFSMLTGFFEVIEFKSSVSAVRLAVSLPKTAPNLLPEWFPPAALPESGRLAAGRGLTAKQARESCLGEAAELVSACFAGREGLIRACWRDVADQALHPNSLHLASRKQLECRDRWNDLNGTIDWLPAPLDDFRIIDWVKAIALDGGEDTLIPAAHCRIGYFEPGDEAAFAIADSNGCAAGKALDDACISAFFELVERDAASLWWYGRHARPELVPSGNSEAGNLFTLLRARKRTVHLLDLTTDIGIPVCAAISADSMGYAVAIGTAAHSDAGRAAVSAMTEMLQVEMSIALRLRTALEDGDNFGFWLRRVSFSSMPHLLPIGERPLPDHLKMRPTIAECALLCRKAGLRIYAVDLTRPEIGVSVARVIVPGLRPRQLRLAEGRLFDVPVSLGWSNTRLAADEMNPVPLLI